MILNADARAIPLASESVHCVVTSPPYWGLRDYGTPGQIGLEANPEAYVAALVEVFREVWRVLRDDGTLWLNLGDCYATGAGRVGEHPGGGEQGARWKGEIARPRDVKRSYRSDRAEVQPAEFAHGRGSHAAAMGPMTQPNRMPIAGLKPKDLVGIPWRVAFALQADGWWLRSDVIWSKPNPMPESVEDRPTKSHEYLFLLAKGERYYYDHEAIKEPLSASMLAAIDRGPRARPVNGYQHDAHSRFGKGSGNRAFEDPASLARIAAGGRNRRTVWEIPTVPYPEAHFAVFPETLVEPCVLAGTSERGGCPACGAGWRRETEAVRTFESGSGRSGNLPAGKNGAGLQGGGETGDIRRGPVVHTTTTGWAPSCACGHATTTPAVVLDPFAGSGTVGAVCHRLGRRFVGLELKPAYCALAYRRTAQLGLL